MKTLALVLFLCVTSTVFVDTVGVHYGVPFMVRVLICGIVGGIIGWTMKKLSKGA